MRLSVLVLFLLLARTSSVGLARTGDADKPVHIESDRAELDRRAGIGRYIGNVRITQGSMRILADELRIFIAGNKIDQMVATGHPVRLRQLTDDNREITGQALRIVYRASDNDISLEEDAELRQDGNRFASERISYNIGTGVVTAGTGEAGERVEVTIQPETVEAGRVQTSP